MYQQGVASYFQGLQSANILVLGLFLGSVGFYGVVLCFGMKSAKLPVASFFLGSSDFQKLLSNY